MEKTIMASATLFVAVLLVISISSADNKRIDNAERYEINWEISNNGKW